MERHLSNVHRRNEETQASFLLARVLSAKPNAKTVSLPPKEWTLGGTLQLLMVSHHVLLRFLFGLLLSLSLRLPVDWSPFLYPNFSLALRRNT
jgi:hypothetical protein